jgi:hypothetical protein
LNNDAVYLAAVLDCEGWITLSKLGNSRGVGLVLTLGVGNTNYVLTDWLKNTYGGSVYKTHRDSVKHKDYYTWRIHGNKALEVLRLAYPYMMMKRAQAEVAIEFQTNMHNKNTYNEPCTTQYVDYMHSLKKRMSVLNRKGKDVSPATTNRKDTRPTEMVGSEVIV